MTVTLTANYKETLKAETVELIDELLEDNHDLGCMLTFIDENSEDDFQCYYEDYVEYLRTEIDTHFVYKDELYEITEEEDLSDDDIFEANKNPDGTINFIVQYYNGSCGFHEAIQRSLDKLNEEK